MGKRYNLNKYGLGRTKRAVSVVLPGDIKILHRVVPGAVGKEETNGKILGEMGIKWPQILIASDLSPPTFISSSDQESAPS